MIDKDVIVQLFLEIARCIFAILSIFYSGMFMYGEQIEIVHPELTDLPDLKMTCLIFFMFYFISYILEGRHEKKMKKKKERAGYD